MHDGTTEEILYRRQGNVSRYAPCDLCEKEDIWAQWHCKTCPMNLCEQCKIEHLKKRVWASHEVSQIDINTQISSEICPVHPTKAISLFCKTCDKLVCNECITSACNGHSFLSYCDALKSKKEQLAEFHKSVKEELSRNEEAMKMLEEKSVDLKSKADGMREWIDKQTRDAVDEAEKICNDLEKNVKEVEVIYERAMEEFSTTVSHLGRKVTEVIKQCDNMKDKDLHEICKFLKDNSELSTTSLPKIPVYSPPVFLRGRVRSAELRRQFGTIVSSEKLFDVTTGRLPHCMVLDDTNNCWTCQDECTGIEKFSISNMNLSKVTEIATDFKVGQVAHFKGADIVLLVLDKSRRRIFKVRKSGKIQKIRDLEEDGPKGLLMNRYGEILVYFKCKIVIFSSDLKTQRQEIEKDLDGTNMANDIQFITQNYNGDYVFIDNLEKSLILAIDNSGIRKRWTYGADTELNASALACDKQKNILVSNYVKDEVFILSQDGDYLCRLFTAHHEIHKPLALGIDSSRRLWVGQGNGQEGRLTVYKYMYLSS